MLKKLLLASILISSFAFASTSALAEDFGSMNPTVRITSYKKLYTDFILAYGSGSGTIVSKDGLIISNHHVIYDDNEQKPLDTFEVCITFDVKEEPVCKYTARLVAHDKDLDIAILRLNQADVFGKSLPDLKYLSYQTNAEPKEGSTVQVIGYPGSGGETITITKGQVSGFETYNGYKYFKTDTDFDYGSSGGTALDEQGNYIGIPTYIRSYAENVGYFLDLREAVPWIKEHIGGSTTLNKKAEDRLKMELARLQTANDNLKHTYADYPNLSIEIPEGWKFYGIDDDALYVEQESITDPVGLSIYFSYYQFEINEGYLNKLDEELSKLKSRYPDYKKEKTTFNGYDAYHITYTYFNQRYHSIYIPYGYVLVSMSYGITLDEEEKQTETIQPVLNTIKLGIEKIKEPDISQTITFEDPGFSITMADDWRILKNMSSTPMDLLAEAVQKDNFDGYLHIYYNQIPKDERGLSAEDRVDEATQYIGGKLIYKKDDVVIDGLEGWMYTYEYEGEDYQKMHKMLTIKLQNGNYEFEIYYDDLSDNFDKNIAGIEQILQSFRFTEKDLPGKGEYDYGSLNYQFSDVQYHRFASDISDLADKGILTGYPDGTFKPEQLVSRAETLKIVLASKNHLEEEKGLGKEIDFNEYDTQTNTFWDVRAGNWFNPYVQYAYQNEIVTGYANKTFGPERTVNLVEALKMITGVFEIPLWQGETSPWYKVYMDKGYELGLMPRGMDDPGRFLTRAELSYIVNRVYNQAK